MNLSVSAVVSARCACGWARIVSRSRDVGQTLVRAHWETCRRSVQITDLLLVGATEFNGPVPTELIGLKPRDGLWFDPELLRIKPRGQVQWRVAWKGPGVGH